jgi:hypothetical protein
MIDGLGIRTYRLRRTRAHASEATTSASSCIADHSGNLQAIGINYDAIIKRSNHSGKRGVVSGLAGSRKFVRMNP